MNTLQLREGKHDEMSKCQVRALGRPREGRGEFRRGGCMGTRHDQHLGFPGGVGVLFSYSGSVARLLRWMRYYC